MAVEAGAGWDPKSEGDPEVTGQEPAPTGDPKTPKRDLAATRDPQMAQRDPKMAKWDPPSPKGDPKTSKDPPPEGPPLFLDDFSGGLEGERWRPETGPLGRPRRPPARTRLRNRRYAALRQLIEGGEYFSEEEMRARQPRLYQHYIGQYEGADTADPPPPGPPPRPPAPPTPQTVGQLLLLRWAAEAAVPQRLRRRDGDSGDEEEEEEEEEEEGSPHPWVPDAAERAMLRQEFTTRMHQRFLDGEDGDFDYSQVDENPDLDNLDIVSRDAEERYFDEEEPSDAPRLE